MEKRKPKGFYSRRSNGELLEYGREKEYDRLSRKGLEERNSRYYTVLCRKKLVGELIPESKNGRSRISLLEEVLR